MQFCPKCGRLMLPKKDDEGIALVCSLCNHVVKGERIDGYSVVKTVEPEKDITVIEERAGVALPTAKARCPGCGHDKAYWWLRQTRAADEPTTRFYRCVKCGKVWREYA